MRTRVSEKGQVVIPKEVRDKLGLRRGTVLRVRVEGKKVILEPVSEPPEEIFVDADPSKLEEILEEAKRSGDKAIKLLQDLGVLDEDRR